MVCGRGYAPYVKKLMAVKRTRSRIYFKQQVGFLVERILKENDFLDTYKTYTTQTHAPPTRFAE